MAKEHTRFGVYVPPDLAQELNKLMKSMGIESRSKLLQEALRLFIAENRWNIAQSVVGAVVVLYNHEVRGVDEELTNIQHRFLEIIVSALHVHIDRERCMLVIAVRGNSERIKEFLKELHNIKGVILVRPAFIEAV
ncbi:MAG: CopG family ribbon-helix-helix protein [Ignisphaera sp.]|nr:CopG family ribbon-helix-helix protein [Ignisphaera sp.]